MRQRFHKFRAGTLDDAYLAMRRSLGDEAIVVRTATVPDGGWLGRILGQKVVEVTASVTVEDDAAPQLRNLTPAERKYQATGNALKLRPGSADVGSDDRVRETVAFFRSLVADAQERAGMAAQEAKHETPPPATTPRPAAPVVMQVKEPPAPQPAPKPDAAPLSAEELRANLTEMREMLSVLSAEMPSAGLQPEFVPHYQLLLNHGVSRRGAASLIQAAASRGDVRAFRNPRVFLERLKMEIRRDIRVTGGIALQAGKRKVVALVGATGVGKTTNLAKLGALYSVQERARIGIITTDTYRVAATDQLEVYAGIIDVTMHIVHDAAGMRTVLKSFTDRDLVLIDTAGGSPFNRTQMTEVRELLDAAQPDEVHLLISANTSLEDAREVITHFSILRPTSLFFTKLDETRRYGPLYCLAAESGLPLSYFSVGQNVPDDIMPASGGTIAKLVVDGGENLGGTSSKSA